MMFLLLLSVVLPLAIGFALCCILWPQARPVWSSSLLKLSLSVGAGFGLLSCVYFLQLAFVGHSRRLFLAELIALLIALVAVLIYRSIREKGSQASAPERETVPKTRL